MLRRLASVTKKTQEDRKYFVVEHTRRRRETKNLLGEVTSSIVTATLQLSAGPRVMYKMLKRSSKSGQLNNRITA